ASGHGIGGGRRGGSPRSRLGPRGGFRAARGPRPRPYRHGPPRISVRERGRAPPRAALSGGTGGRGRGSCPLTGAARRRRSGGRRGGTGAAGVAGLGRGVEAAGAFRPWRDGNLPAARMVIDGDDYPARTRMLIADLPGRGPDWVVVSAHIDGHPHGESAMDN